MKRYISGLGANFLAEISILFILGITPLFFNYFYPSNIDLYKLVGFKIFTLLLFFAVIWRLSEFEIILAPKLGKRLWPFLALFGFLTISLWFSIDISTSWLGSYDRQEGLLSWFFYGLWTSLVALYLGIVAKEKKVLIIRRFLVASVCSSFFVSVYAILQFFGFDFITWLEAPKVTGRAVSSFGQPNYLACWLLLVLPFNAYLLRSAKNNSSRFWWGLFFITGLGGLLATGSRAAFLVFLGISTLWSVWYLAKRKILSRRKIGLVILSGLIITALFISFLIAKNPSRISELSDFKKGSTAVRLELWQSGWQAFLQKPILGYGLENQKEVYVKYYRSDWALYARPNTYSDRAHNIILDTLLTGGVLGLGFFIVFLWWVYRNLLLAFNKEEYQEVAAFLLWSLSVYLVSLMFNFSVTPTNIYFWFIVSLSIIISGEPLVTCNKNKKTPELSFLIISLCAVFLFVYGSLTEIKRLKADYYFGKTLESSARSEYFTALVLKDYINETGPNKVTGSFYEESLSLRFLEVLPAVKDKANSYVMLKYLESISRTLPDNNFENKFVKAFATGAIGNLYQSELEFNALAAISPELPKIYLAWGDVLMYNHNYPGARIKFDKALSLLPDENNPYLSEQQKNGLTFYKNATLGRLAKINLLTK